ncbi:hypothetical protein [Paenibacillus nasutitermitis]|uniref:Uncharacterized protein n=1 Tax=Paenibacillus nasutitermitis TaxID=1652958 RepID=A0A917DWZ5_9BACL|nr:hypothetical protein [Paenibacillus nasutitermitis]GGD76688.1 hypothetical protein GCM10010911_38500 [Paenibacillus nasutitermitis]
MSVIGKHSPSTRLDKHTGGLFLREDGAVSVYLVVATAGILLLTSLLIDYARIAAFHKQLEVAAQSGIRSTLSAYDNQLYEQYGLFGAGGTDRNEIFRHVAENNWMDNDDAFQMLRIKPVDAHVNSYEVLGTHAVFKRQVLEEMKYKAPVDFALEVVSKFAPLAEAMKEASTSVEVLEEVRKLYDKREKHLEKTLELQRKSARAAEQEMDGLLAVGGMGQSGGAVAGIVSGYGSYLGWIAHDSAPPAGARPKYSLEIGSYAMTARAVSNDLAHKSSNALIRHRELEPEALEQLEEARRCNDEMSAVIQRLQDNRDNTGYDLISGEQSNDQPASGASAPASQLQEVRQAAQDMILPSEWFAGYKEEVTAQTRKFNSFNAGTAGFQSGVSAALSNPGSGAMMSGSAERLQQAFNQYADDYIRPGVVIKARADGLNERQSSDEQRKEKEREAKSKWNEVRGWMKGMSESGQSEHQQAFDEVKQRFEANLLFNELGADEAISGEEATEDPHDAASASMSGMGSIFSGMADMLTGIRDPLYMNEYIVHRFNAYDPKNFESMMKSTGDSGFSDSLALGNQEIEYILYGFHDPAANIAAAYGEIFGVRLAVRTMEGLVECKGMGHPLLVLAAALLYGLEKSIADMMMLAKEGTTPLSKYVSTNLTYLDYLRVFLLLHGNSEKRTSRTIAVIEQNTEVILAGTSTGLTGELSASVNVWFLPGLMRSFTVLGLLNGKVKGGRYEATKTIGWSYQ